jgi:uncharacterized protein
MKKPESAEGKGAIDTTQSAHARLRTLPLKSIMINEGFWAERQAVNRRISLEHGYQMLEKAGNFHNFRMAAGRKQGEYRGRLFLDENVYKWIEAVAYELGKAPDDKLQQMVDEAISLIADAQQADGYLNTYYITQEPENRWTDLDHSHELYCAGHLFQAAIAYHRATGNANLLNIATRFADHIDSVIGPDKQKGAPGHSEIEMALVELYRETGEKNYLSLSKFFIDQRGQGKMRGLGWVGPEYHQDRVPVREALIVEGHAVRALYLTSGITDLYLETGEKELLDALTRQWHDMIGGKLHVTGGAGARYEGESFGDPFELPNDQCYCETCAAIGSIMWNWRMLLATGEARFIDLLEQTLYNGFLSGPALDGKNFFYINPLLSRGGYGRAEWYEVACCPPNIMRTIASVQQFIATNDTSGIQIHLYSAAAISTEKASFQMETDYPWQGEVKIRLDEVDGSEWTLSLRIPSWCNSASVRINGEATTVRANPDSYIEITHTWQQGDTIELSLPMTPHLLTAHPSIDTTRGCTAIQRGPILYCLEQIDQAAGVDIMAVEIDETIPLEAEWNTDLLGGVMTVNASGYTLDTSVWGDQIYQRLSGRMDLPKRQIQLKAIPYYAWGNRGADAMRVWIPLKTTE